MWTRLIRWPESGEKWLGLPPGSGDFVKDLFQNKRLRLEIQDLGDGERECRVPCRHGFLFPVNASTWAWSGPGGTWTLRVLRCLGDDAHLPANGPVFREKDAGTRNDDAQVDFAVSRLLEVADVVKALKRRPGRAGGNPNLAKFAKRALSQSVPVA